MVVRSRLSGASEAGLARSGMGSGTETNYGNTGKGEGANRRREELQYLAGSNSHLAIPGPHSEARKPNLLLPLIMNGWSTRRVKKKSQLANYKFTQPGSAMSP